MVDGTYTIIATAIDLVGLSYATSSTSCVDNTPPIANITLVDGSLPGAKVVSGSVTVLYTISDAATSVATWTISIDGGTWTGMVAGTYTWNTTVLPDGAHTLQIQATDVAGNVGYSTMRTIEVNNTRAGVVILEPATGAHIRGTQTIRVDAPASTYEVRMMVGTNGTTWYNPTTGAIGSATDTTPADGWTVSWNTGTFADGLWSVKAIAYGTGGTMLGSSTNTNIEIDNTAGEFSILIQSILSKTGTISTDGVVGDIERIVFEYEKDGTYLIDVALVSPFNVSWNTLGMSDGTYTIVATSYDEVSNTYSTSTIIHLDNTGPIIGSISPTANSLLNGTQTISWSATDAISGVVAGTSCVSIDGGTWTSVATSSYTWLSASLKNAHTFQIRAMDTEGNYGYSEQILVRFDNESPHAPILSQIPLIVGSTTLSVSGSVEANATVTVYVNDASAGVVKAGTNGTWTVDVLLTTGTNTITADAKDTFGNGPGERSAFVYVMCDDVSPVAGTVSINSGATYATTSVLHVSWGGYTDGQSGINGYYYSLGTDTASAEFTIATYGEIDTIVQGTNTVYIWARDNAGNVSDYGTDSIIVDTRVPEVTILKIDGSLPGAKIISGSGPISFRVSADTSGVVGTPSVSIDEGTYTVAQVWWSVSGYGTYTLDTRGLRDGLHALKVKAQDRAGNIGYSEMRTIEVNNNLAGLMITKPANGAHISGSQTIRMVVPQDTYRVVVQVHQNGSDDSWWFSPINNSSAGTSYEDGTPTDGWSAPWDTVMFTTSPGDGTYTIKVIAYGTGGTILGSSTNTNIEIDNSINVPVVPAITTPIRGVIAGTVSVDEDTTEVTFEYLRNGTWTIGIDTEAPFSWSWNTYSMPDGTYTIRVTVKDEVGNATSTVTNNFKVDNTPPTASITLVDGSLPGAKVISGSVPVVYIVSDAATSVITRNISIDGGTWTVTPVGTYTWNTIGLSDGAHTLQIQVIDAVGNIGYSTIRIVEVNNTMGGVIILEPLNNAHIRGTQTISVTTPASTYNVAMMVGTDGTTWYDPTTSGEGTDTTPADGWTCNWVTSTWTDGTWTVKAVTYGTGGTMLGSATNIEIEVDNNINIPVLPAIATQTRGVIAGTVSVDSDVVEVSFEYLRNGTYTIGIDIEAPFTWSWNTYGLDGTYTIRVTAKDEVGNQAATVTNAFKVDNTAPIANIILVDGAMPGTKVISGSISVVYTASDTNTSVATRSISIDGGTFTTITTGTYTWNTAGLSDGAHSLQIQVIDAVGNVGYSTMRTIEVNNTKAGVVIIEPATGSHIHGTQTIRVESPASTYEVRMKVSMDGNTWYNPANGMGGYTSDTTPADGWTANWVTTSFEDGVWMVSVEAYGTGGTFLGSVTNTNIEIDNTAGTFSISIASRITRMATISTVNILSDIDRVVFEYGTATGTYTIGVDTLSPFNISWNTLGLVDGTYSIVATSFDEIDNSYATTAVTYVDNSGPQGTITVMNNATYTSSTAVTLNLAYPNPIDISRIYCSNDGVNWVGTSGAPATWANWQLTPGDGQKTVYLKLEDALGNIWETADWIILDTQSPFGSIMINNGDVYTNSNNINLGFTYQDLLSGVSQIRVQEDKASSWQSWTNTTTAMAFAMGYNGLNDQGTRTIYYQIRDNAGNISATFSDTIVYDYSEGPKGTLTIDNGASHTADNEVILSLEWSDNYSGVKQVRFKNLDDATWQIWENPLATKPWVLTGGTDTTQKVVQCELMDGAGNVRMITGTITLNDDAPRGTISINEDATYTTSETVVLKLVDAQNISDYRYSNNGVNWTAWITTTAGATRTWQLILGDGQKIVYAQLRNNASMTAQCSDTIILDTQMPFGSILINGGAKYANTSPFSLEFEYHDVPSGVSQIRWREDVLPWADGQWTTPLATTTVTLSDNGNGTRTIYYQIRDKAGNISGTYSDTIFLDTYQPTGAIIINNNATYTVTGTVSLDLLWSDTNPASMVKEVRYSNDGVFDTEIWEAPVTTKAWEILSPAIPYLRGNDVWVYYQLKDYADNITTGTISDHIVFDLVQPEGTITINGTNTYATATDVSLGMVWTLDDVVGLRLSNDLVHWSAWETKPATQTTKTQGWSVEYGLSLPINDGTKTVYMEVKDAAGNTKIYTDSIILDRVIPTGSVVINNGDIFVATTTITAAFTWSDDTSGVDRVRFGTATTSWGTGSWTSATTSVNFVLTGADGTKTIYYQVMDYAGLVSGTISDTIMLDTIVPQATFTINEDATHTTSIAVELVQFKYFDATSGINQIRFRNDGETWQEVWQDMTEMLIKWKLRAEDGTRTVHMQVSDKAGNMATYSDSIVLDTTVPFGTITILGQNLGTAYATATNVTLNLTLADDVVEMRFSNNKIGSWSTWQAAAGTVSNWLLNQGLSENEVFTDGTRCVWMEVKDIAGKTAMYSDNIILDRTAPSGNVIVNGANEFVDIGTRTVRLSMSYADATVGVDAIRYGYEGLSGTETWVYDWGTPTVQGTVTLNDEEGIRKLIYEIRDVVGWTYKTSDTIMLDTIVPQIATTGSITVVYPTAQTRAKEGDVVTIMALVQDVGAGIETISLDASNIGGSKEQPMSPGTQAGVYLAQVTLSHTPIATETQASISVTAQDRAGNQASSTTTVFVDNKMPIFSTVDTLLSVYKNGDMLQLTAKLDSASYTVSIDLSGLDSTYRLGSESVTTTSEGTYTIVYQIGTANTTPDGSYELKVKAQDQAGNVSWRSTSVLLDNTAPVQLLKAEPSIVRNGDTIVFTYYGTDPGLPITEIPYSEMQKLDSNAVGTLILHDDGNLPDMVSNDGIYTASYTISATNTVSGTATGGLVSVSATIVDSASNTLHARVTITLDNTKPGVELIAIDPRQTINNIIIYGTW